MAHRPAAVSRTTAGARAPWRPPCARAAGEGGCGVAVRAAARACAGTARADGGGVRLPPSPRLRQRGLLVALLDRPPDDVQQHRDGDLQDDHQPDEAPTHCPETTPPRPVRTGVAPARLHRCSLPSSSSTGGERWHVNGQGRECRAAGGHAGRGRLGAAPWRRVALRGPRARGERRPAREGQPREGRRGDRRDGPRDRPDDDNQAQITLAIDDPRFKPLHAARSRRSATRRCRASRAARSRCSPGPNSNPKIADGGAIKARGHARRSSTSTSCSTRSTRRRARRCRSSSTAAPSRSARTRSRPTRALDALNPALSQARQTTQELAGDQATFERALVESAGVVSASPRARATSRPASQTARRWPTARGRVASLDSALRRAPEALRRSNTTLAEAAQRAERSASRAARRAAGRAAARERAQARRGRSCTRRGPVVGQVHDHAPRRHGDPARAAEARRHARGRAFASTVGACRARSDVVQAARRTPPTWSAALLNGFGGTTGPYYDANGHYVRIALAGNITSPSEPARSLPTPPPGAVQRVPRRDRRTAARAPRPSPLRTSSNPFAAPDEPQCNPKDSP